MQKASSPRLWIIAGPNGSGKTTLYESVDVEGFGRSVWIVNPDALSRRIADIERREPEEANVEALNRIQAWLEATIRAHQTVGVETVLSTPKYRPIVELALALGFEVGLIYVLLDGIERNLERIRVRVAKGGHGVPEDKVRLRSERSLAQLPWFLHRAEHAFFFDNSGAEPKLIGRKVKGAIQLDPEAPEALKHALS